MQSAVFRALEFDRVRAALAHEALTPLGRARAFALEPASTPDVVRAALALTTDAVTYVREGGSLAIWAPEQLEDILGTLEVDDQPLAPLALLGLARFLTAVGAAATGLRRAGSARLAAIASGASTFEDEVAAVHRAIEPSGDVSDRASPALREIRESLRRQRAKLRSSLESLTRGRDTAKYLQDQIVTDRDGRYVVVVRAEHRDAIPGIVHGSSTSGASLYLEPLTTVALNNEIVTLADREREEILRILLALSRAFRQRGDDLEATLDAAAQIDDLHARASLALRVDGLAPEIVDDGRVEFRGARHPLLIPAVRDLIRDVEAADDEDRPRSESPTPAGRGLVIASDLVLIPPARALVISGPNTGGKTVALKAMGVLALMAQSGLLIPVDPGSRLTPFRSMFADIGDEQSLSASLSTFSAHIANIVAMDAALELPALVLLDEVGSGTDPTEGGALGAAVIDHFRRRGAVVVATTHDDLLKSYAATTDGVVTAGFGFNPETYAPTYRLLYGAPGRSLAFEIAERLGMAHDIIADARNRRTGRESQLAAHLSRIDLDMAAIERDRRELGTAREGLAAEQAAMRDREARLAEREAVLKKRLDDRVNEKLRDAKAEVDRIVGQLKTKADTLAEQAGKRAGMRSPVLSSGDVGELRTEARTALGAISEALGQAPEPVAPTDAFDAPPSLGQTVYVSSFASEGIVRGIAGAQIEVDIRGKRMRVPLSALRRVNGAAAAAARADRPRSVSVAASGSQARSPQAAAELMLIGTTVDEAIDRTERFLDGALLADARRLRIVHGHGTGKLRQALGTFLRAHPLVASVAPAPDNEGGSGATIVELKD